MESAESSENRINDSAAGVTASYDSMNDRESFETNFR